MPWGERRLRPGTRRRQAGSALGRLRRLPLVPCHGSRELRRRRNRRPHERTTSSTSRSIAKSAPISTASTCSPSMLSANRAAGPSPCFSPPTASPSGAEPTSPRRSHYGRPSFKHVLTEISRIWRDERDKVTTNSTALRPALPDATAQARSRPATSPIASSPPPRRHSLGAVDLDHGGLKGAPKFPQGPTLQFPLDDGPSQQRCKPSPRQSTSRCAISARAAFTIISAAVLPATPPIISGSFRISRRCSTTMPSSWRLLARVWLSTPRTACSASESRKQSPLSSATCGSPRAPSPRAMTPIPKARKAATMSGPG